MCRKSVLQSLAKQEPGAGFPDDQGRAVRDGQGAMQGMGSLVMPLKVQQKLAPIGVRLCMIGAGECLAMIIRILSDSMIGPRCLVSSGKN